MSERKNIIVLYTRLPDYFFACAKYMVQTHPLNFIIIRKKPDENAPFVFENEEHIQLRDLESFSNETEVIQYCDSLSPIAMISAGWSEPAYRKVTKHFRSRIPVICGLDNFWENNWKQTLKTLFFSGVVHGMFSHIWVTGMPQYEFAKRMGYPNNKILKGYYVGSASKYAAYQHLRPSGDQPFPKSFIYFGRLVDYKFVDGLVDAFRRIDDSIKNDWKLIIVGNGPDKEKLAPFATSNIIFHDFMQPEELAEMVAQEGVYCLPSHNEHWGVALHEAACAGLPIIASDTVMAATEFLIHRYNGFRFSSQNAESLKYAIERIMTLDDRQLYEMGKKSRLLSNRITHEMWAANLLSVL